nr:hypothetical protein [uncultured Actinoplanes sp.]
MAAGLAQARRGWILMAIAAFSGAAVVAALRLPHRTNKDQG